MTTAVIILIVLAGLVVWGVKAKHAHMYLAIIGVTLGVFIAATPVGPAIAGSATAVADAFGTAGSAIGNSFGGHR